MKIGINVLFIGQFSYNTSQPRMLVTERHQEYANKETAHNFENFLNVSIFLKLKGNRLQNVFVNCNEIFKLPMHYISFTKVLLGHKSLSYSSLPFSSKIIA